MSFQQKRMPASVVGREDEALPSLKRRPRKAAVESAKGRGEVAVSAPKVANAEKELMYDCAVEGEIEERKRMRGMESRDLADLDVARAKCGGRWRPMESEAFRRVRTVCECEKVNQQRC